jgi:hypothetical protein
MTVKRNYMKLNKSLCIKFGEKTFEKRLTKNEWQIASVINLIMRKYINGDLDALIKKKKGKFTAPDHIETSTAGVDKKIRDEFAAKAWKADIIVKPSKAFILVEWLMRAYLRDTFKLLKGEL